MLCEHTCERWATGADSVVDTHACACLDLCIIHSTNEKTIYV
jgi:hypothetical protein